MRVRHGAAIARRAALLVAAIVALPGALRAQERVGRTSGELRLDAFGTDPLSAQLGAGVSTRLGTYVRAGLAGGAGMTRRLDGDGPTLASGRVEATARFVLDPFRERRRGAYAAAGLALHFVEGVDPEPRLTAVVGVEGSARGRWVPSIEAGFGGGVRVGLVLRPNSAWRR